MQMYEEQQLPSRAQQQVQTNRWNLTVEDQPVARGLPFKQYRVGSLMLSTSNIFHRHLLRELGVELLGEDRIDLRLSNEDIHSYVDDILFELKCERRFNYDNEADRTELLELLLAFYRCLPDSPATLLSAVPPPDDLATQMAEELAKKYYEHLEITVEDVKTCFAARFENGELPAIDLFRRLIDAVTHARIDEGRMELRALLPSEDFILIVLQSAQPGFFARMMSKIMNAARWVLGQTVSDANKDDSNIDEYKRVVAKTLDKYISWWKLSIFGHHHDQRARYLKAEILNEKTSVRRIQLLLSRQQTLVTPECYDENNQWTGGEAWVSFESEAVNNKWNNPEEVVHHSQLTDHSGFFKVLNEALAIDPENPVYTPDSSSCFN